ncbi:MAG TPA: MFS transporter [Candidatus Methylomirabilis sp.]|nr:MFS transporter [Candidatus Methylomirabilis sp.]
MSTQAIALNAAGRRRYLLTLFFAGFVLTGLEITLVGPLLPLFIQRWSLTDSQAGVFFTVEFSASLGGVWLASWLTHYFGARTPLLAGYFLMAVGLATVNSSVMTVSLLSLVALGLGYGLVVPPTNLGVAELGGARSASLVSLVNFAWGAGAVSCSPLVLLALKNGLLQQFLYGFAAFGALLTFSFFFAEFPKTKHDAPGAAAPAGSVAMASTIALAALFFLYVGIEVSLGSWAAAFAKRLSGGGAGIATVAPMFFYGGLMTGRALAPLVLSLVREFRIVLCALFVVIAGNTLLVLAPQRSVAFLSLVVAGLGCATIFPVCVTWLSRWYGRRASRVGGLMFSMSSLGSAGVPWFVGLVSSHTGGLRVGLLVPMASAIAMLLLLLLVRRQAAA